MADVPFYLNILFVLTTLATVGIFFLASQKNKVAFGIVLLIMIFQAFLGLQRFYHDSDAMPPRLMLMLLPSAVPILFAFFTRTGKKFINALDLKTYTYLHTVRLPVEVVIFGLFMHQLMPQSMSFEGRNFDVISGLTAPIIAYLGFRQGVVNKPLLLIWNIVCLGLVLQVVGTGILSAPSPFQQLSFEQPNVAVLYFPFIWLPTIVVPIVIFGHLVAVRRLLGKN